MTTPTPDEICERLEGLSVWPRNVADAFAEHIPARHTTMLYAVSDAMHDAKATIERLSAELNTEREWREDLQANVIEHSLKVERLSALVEESLYHLRLDEAAKAYHERALTALGKDASAPHIQKREKREE